MSDIKLFWERVNFLIKTNKTTQAEVSIRCDFSPRRLQNLSAGNRLPDCFEAVKIAEVLGTTVEYLVTGKETFSSKDEIRMLKQKIMQFAESVQ